MNWFRLYAEARNDAKLRSLTDAQHRVWFNLLCYASEQTERGVIAEYDAELLALEVAGGDTDLLTGTLDRLARLRIVTVAPDTISFIHWLERQYDKPSDRPAAVRERVAKSRAGNATPPPSNTPNGHIPNGVSRDMEPVTPSNAAVTPSNAHTQNREYSEDNRSEEIPPTPQTSPAQPMPANAGGNNSPKPDKGRKPRTHKPSSVAGWGYPLLWQLVTEQQGYAPDWNYAVQTDAVNRILAKHPTEQPGDLARFLAYKATCYRADPHSQPTFTAYEADYAGWVRAGKPPRVEKEPGAGAGRGASHLFSVTGQPYRLVDKGA